MAELTDEQKKELADLIFAGGLKSPAGLINGSRNLNIPSNPNPRPQPVNSQVQSLPQLLPQVTPQVIQPKPIVPPPAQPISTAPVGNTSPIPPLVQIPMEATNGMAPGLSRQQIGPYKNKEIDVNTGKPIYASDDRVAAQKQAIAEMKKDNSGESFSDKLLRLMGNQNAINKNAQRNDTHSTDQNLVQHAFQ